MRGPLAYPANRPFESTHFRNIVSFRMFHRQFGYDYRIPYGPRRSPLEARHRLRSLWVSASPHRVLRIASDPERTPAPYTTTPALPPRRGGLTKEFPDHRSHPACDFAGWYSRPSAPPPSFEPIQA